MSEAFGERGMEKLLAVKKPWISKPAFWECSVPVGWWLLLGSVWLCPWLVRDYWGFWILYSGSAGVVQLVFLYPSRFNKGWVYPQMTGPAASSPVLQDTELLPSLWSSAWADLPYWSLAVSGWSETVFSVHCHWHDMRICLGPPPMSRSSYKIVGFLRAPMDPAQVTIGERFRASGDSPLGHRVEWVADASRYTEVVRSFKMISLIT